MKFSLFYQLFIVFFIVLSGCSSVSPPTSQESAPLLSKFANNEQRPDAENLDMLARNLAKLLNEPVYNHLLHELIYRSPGRENTVILKGFLNYQPAVSESKLPLENIAAKMNMSKEQVLQRIDAFPVKLGLFYPVPAQREQAKSAYLNVSGQPQQKALNNYLVAWEPYWLDESEYDEILAYDAEGSLVRLSAKEPPATPVLMLSPENLAEKSTQSGKAGETANTLQGDDCDPTVFECPGDGGGSGNCPPTGGSTQYFVLKSVIIYNDHEGWPRGTPEFEIYNAPWEGSGSNRVERFTNLILDGSTHTDASGNSIPLPNVNSTNWWYDIDCGYAIFPVNGNLGRAIVGYEDDTQKGELRIDNLNDLSIGFKCSLKSSGSGPTFGCYPNGAGWLKFVNGIIGGDDDLFNRPIRLTEAQSGQIYQVDATDWSIKYSIENR